MRKVADTSVLRSEIAIEYLRRSPLNELVVPQLVLCECLQGDAIRNARQSMASLALFSRQVLVLKGDGHLHRLEPRPRGLESRLIDERLTRGLRTNLLHNLSQTGSNAAIVNAMIAHDESQTDRVISLYAGIAAGIKTQLLKEGRLLSADELKAIRVRRIISPDTFDLVEKRTMKATAYALKNAGLDVTKISPRDALSAVPLRFALAIEALSLDWVATGGLESRSEKAFSNDLRDASHVAFSTFFVSVRPGTP